MSVGCWRIVGFRPLRPQPFKPLNDETEQEDKYEPESYDPSITAVCNVLCFPGLSPGIGHRTAGGGQGGVHLRRPDQWRVLQCLLRQGQGGHGQTRGRVHGQDQSCRGTRRAGLEGAVHLSGSHQRSGHCRTRRSGERVLHPAVRAKAVGAEGPWKLELEPQRVTGTPLQQAKAALSRQHFKTVACGSILPAKTGLLQHVQMSRSVFGARVTRRRIGGLGDILKQLPQQRQPKNEVHFRGGFIASSVDGPLSSIQVGVHLLGTFGGCLEQKTFFLQWKLKKRGAFRCQFGGVFCRRATFWDHFPLSHQTFCVSSFHYII